MNVIYVKGICQVLHNSKIFHLLGITCLESVPIFVIPQDHFMQSLLVLSAFYMLLTLLGFNVCNFTWILSNKGLSP